MQSSVFLTLTTFRRPNYLVSLPTADRANPTFLPGKPTTPPHVSIDSPIEGEDPPIKMTDSNSDAQDISQQLAQQVSSATGGDTDPSTIQQKVQEAMSQGQESGALNTGQLQEQLQDGSLQEKVKDAMEKGQGAGGILNSASGHLSTLLSS